MRCQDEKPFYERISQRSKQDRRNSKRVRDCCDKARGSEKRKANDEGLDRCDAAAAHCCATKTEEGAEVKPA
jgi:hypothetical protein